MGHPRGVELLFHFLQADDVGVELGQLAIDVDESEPARSIKVADVQMTAILARSTAAATRSA